METRLRKESLVVGRIPRHQLLNRGLVKSKCLQTSQIIKLRENISTQTTLKSGSTFVKASIKYDLIQQRKIWATPTTQEAEHYGLVLNNQGGEN